MKKAISPCIGEYDGGDITCIGDSDSDNEDDSRPCSWRKKCKVFKQYMKDTNTEAVDYLEAGKDEDGNYYANARDGYEAFRAFCDDLVEKSKKKKKKRKIKKTKLKVDNRLKGPTVAAKTAAALALAARSKERKAVLFKMFMEFRRSLTEHLEDIEFASPGKAVLPGQFFIINRSEASSYLSLYCKSSRGRDMPIACFMMKTHSLSFNVKIPVEVDSLEKELSKVTFDRLSPVLVKGSGRFKSIIKKAKKVELALIAESIANLVDSGNIELSS